ncbi:MAG: hypothetical protein DRJ21_01285 [Candidatus Methanomethylicota archaeon]|uniref:NADH-quinone oxidoreductase subunit A n=1 Tax=Thermoproteota archaeon TaxID=2056631 RepID=A0A497EVV2_9CREN|nr:MAG: hypothetical protein DRJ21_01285 [Candidatus Verstraetearchaeota archaeon]
MWGDLILAAPIAFIIILVVFLLMYLSGNLMAPKHEHTPDELEPYACGEKFPAERLQMSIQLYRFALYFTIFDVAAFILALATNAPLVAFIMYVALILLALIIIPKR